MECSFDIREQRKKCVFWGRCELSIEDHNYEIGCDFRGKLCFMLVRKEPSSVPIGISQLGYQPGGESRFERGS